MRGKQAGRGALHACLRGALENMCSAGAHRRRRDARYMHADAERSCICAAPALTAVPAFHMGVPSILPIGKRSNRSPAMTTERISLPDCTSS